MSNFSSYVNFIRNDINTKKNQKTKYLSNKPHLNFELNYFFLSYITDKKQSKQKI